jgi:hypothetical protein
MAVYNTDCYIPLEILDLIAAVDVKAYRAMLAIPLFARSLGPGKVVDFMIGFGYSVAITKSYIVWYLNGKRHRVAGPAIECANGNKYWYSHEKLHRSPVSSDLDPGGGQAVGPAIEYDDGHKEWYLNGKRHRDDGPAVEYANGDKEWWVDGKLHRSPVSSDLDPNGGHAVGPAIEYANGDKVWYLNGRQHRVDGPAVECEGGHKEWWKDGKRHRDDGPAIEYADGDKEWYLNGKRQPDQRKIVSERVVKVDFFVLLNTFNLLYNLKMAVYNTDCYMPLEMLDLIAAVDVKAYRALLGLPLFARSLNICKIVDFMIAFGYSVKITKYCIIWYLNGKRHRVDGPAIEYVNGDKVWYMFGKLHRSPVLGQAIGPAVEYVEDGHKAWYLNGKWHRVDGPAVEYESGHKEWWLNGIRHRVDGPAVELANGYKAWWLNGEPHRVDGPAIEYEGGYKEWYLNGELQPGQ